MRFVFYTHSLVSDWNHGNAHFLRGVMRELLSRGEDVIALEPENGWSRANLSAEQGEAALARFSQDFPELKSATYGQGFDHAEALSDADVVVVHEWTDPALIASIGALRGRGAAFTLLFHDTHHRAVSATPDIGALDLSGYDGVLAFGETLRESYVARGWGRQVFTWHEAADVHLFRPECAERPFEDLVWIGNWGDDERSAEITQYLIGPAATLGLTGSVRGVRYPREAVERLEAAGLSHGGWIANADVPRAFAHHRVTMHIPRRPYVEALPGIPTIRVFEALACGIPLISAPWEDREELFRPGDFLRANSGSEMERQLRMVINDADVALGLAEAGLETILSRHTCGHRVDELYEILREVGTSRVGEQLAPREAAQ